MSPYITITTIPQESGKSTALAELATPEIDHYKQALGE